MVVDKSSENYCKEFARVAVCTDRYANEMGLCFVWRVDRKQFGQFNVLVFYSVKYVYV